MCGIAGVVGGDARAVQAMLGALRHRGPDASADAAGATAHLGCTRLSIRGGPTGAQPLRTRKGLLVFNGEIYNLDELARELAWYGAEVDARSDTAVVGALLDLLGVRRTVDKLNGMFALAFDDGEAVWLARDPAGVKPLYYRGDAFASEIRPLLGGDARVHGPALARWLTFHYAYGTETFFDGVYRVPAGGIVALPEGRLIRAQDSSLRFGAPNRALDADRLRRILARSVRDALPQERYGIALSGGLDSSLVAVLASAEGEGPSIAYHGRVRAPHCDESEFARAVRGDLVEVEVDAAGCLEALPQVVAALEEPLAGPGSLAQWIVARRAAEDVRVLLSGCGGDELFSGYARHAALLQDAPPPGLERYAPLFARMAGLAPGRRALCGLNRRAPGLFTAEFLAAHPAPEEEFLESFAADGLHPLAAASRAELALTLPALLQVEDRIGMAFSLETRVPLLDRRLLRAASRLAPEQRIHDGNLKALLREAAAPLLPPAVAGRRDKMGFPLPLGEWFAGPWAGFAREVLLDRRTLARGMLDARGVKEALDGQGQYDRGLYAALLLELWHRTFIDG